MTDPTADTIARELSLSPVHGVAAVLRLLDEGNTVPFVARYRKEATGGLDEVAIRQIRERHDTLLELERRRTTILGSIDEQGKLTPALKTQILACRSKTELEDLYLPYRPRRRTRATKARERGLEPLALQILTQPAQGDPRQLAEKHVDPAQELPDVEAVLQGARDIVAELVAEDAGTRELVRRALQDEGLLKSTVARGKKGERSKFEQYYKFQERVKTIPSHRLLALERGAREGFLKLTIEVDTPPLISRITARRGVRRSSPFAAQLQLAIEESFSRLLGPGVEKEVRRLLKDDSDRQAVEVFADNLQNLLLQAPLGNKAVVGIDPGFRTGCKCAAVDATGKFLAAITIYPTRGQADQRRAREDLASFLRSHQPSAIAIGNGTGGRETETFVRELLREEAPNLPPAQPIVVSVNEAGASVYSASDVARHEFPELDLTIRGAISIARRLQDPLAELVKIDPKSIGVGQYQHDVDQALLQGKLGEVVESCVNRVGVALNTASAPLLSFVSGIGPKLAEAVVAYRDAHGAFESRRQLLKVPKLGQRTFQQAAGFLRIREGKQPLDASAVHPERYQLVEQIARDLGVKVGQLIGSHDQLQRIELTNYTSEEVGEPTLRDILAELEKPGRDPRADFEPPRFRDDVHTMADLSEGMWLEGVVTNVVAFGAFVDVGVHQDGLVHISQLSDRYVSDPHDVVKLGDRLRVRVLEVDQERKRIALSAREGEGPKRRGS